MHYIKKASNKSCEEFNFVQKSQWVHISISQRSEVGGLQRLSSLKYCVLKGETSEKTRVITLPFVNPPPPLEYDTVYSALSCACKLCD